MGKMDKMEEIHYEEGMFEVATQLLLGSSRNGSFTNSEWSIWAVDTVLCEGEGLRILWAWNEECMWPISPNTFSPSLVFPISFWTSKPGAPHSLKKGTWSLDDHGDEGESDCDCPFHWAFCSSVCPNFSSSRFGDPITLQKRSEVMTWKFGISVVPVLYKFYHTGLEARTGMEVWSPLHVLRGYYMRIS